MEEMNTSKNELKKRISLEDAIKKVLDDKKIEYVKTNDSNVRCLRRAFERLLKRLGSDIERYKHNGVIEFAEEEMPFMKSLLSQLYDNKGIIADFVNGGKKSKRFSSKEVREFLDILTEEIEKAESDVKKNELEDMGKFFSEIFLWSPLRSVEDCHGLIDSIASCLQDLPIDSQGYYLGTMEHILEKEFRLRYTEAAIEMKKLAEEIEQSKDMYNDDIGIQRYYGIQDPQIRFHYMKRDKRVLATIQEDADLRQYIEKKFGKKAEEIFNYAMLDM